MSEQESDREIETLRRDLLKARIVYLLTAIKVIWLGIFIVCLFVDLCKRTVVNPKVAIISFVLLSTYFGIDYAIRRLERNGE